MPAWTRTGPERPASSADAIACIVNGTENIPDGMQQLGDNSARSGYKTLMVLVQSKQRAGESATVSVERMQSASVTVLVINPLHWESVLVVTCCAQRAPTYVFDEIRKFQQNFLQHWEREVGTEGSWRPIVCGLRAVLQSDARKRKEMTERSLALGAFIMRSFDPGFAQHDLVWNHGFMRARPLYYRDDTGALLSALEVCAASGEHKTAVNCHTYRLYVTQEGVRQLENGETTAAVCGRYGMGIESQAEAMCMAAKHMQGSTLLWMREGKRILDNLIGVEIFAGVKGSDAHDAVAQHYADQSQRLTDAMKTTAASAMKYIADHPRVSTRSTPPPSSPAHKISRRDTPSASPGARRDVASASPRTRSMAANGQSLRSPTPRATVPSLEKDISTATLTRDKCSVVTRWGFSRPIRM